MSKRRSMNRLSRKSIERLSKRKSVDSDILDPDTNIMDDEQTSWWNHLEENTILPHSQIYNETHETAKHLSPDSLLDSSNDTVEWWKNLEHSNTSSDPRRNFNAATARVNILETSTSESEKEANMRKRKVPLRAASRKSEDNAFLNALNDTKVATPVKTSSMKQTRASESHSDVSDRAASQRKSHGNKEHSLSLSPTSNILKSKPIIFKRKKRAKDQNVFQDALTGDAVLDGNAKDKSVALEKESSKRSMQVLDINKSHINNQTKTRKSSLLLRDSDEDDRLNESALRSRSSVHENNINKSDGNKTVRNIDTETDSDNSRSEFLKPKSGFLRRVRKSTESNAFKDALTDSEDVNLSRHKNPSPAINTHHTKSPSLTDLSNFSKESASRSKSKVDIARESAVTGSSPIRRGPRSPSLNASKERSLGSAARQIQDNIEHIHSSSDDSETREMSPVFLKPKSKFSIRSRNRSLSKNPFEEAFEEDDNIGVRNSNTTTSAENDHSSVERNEAAASTSQARRSLSTERDPKLERSMNTNQRHSSDISHRLSSSNDERNVSKKLSVSPKKQIRDTLGSNDAAGISKSVLRQSRRIGTPEKRISSSGRKFNVDVSEVSKESTRANALLPVDETADTNQALPYMVTSDDSRDDTDKEQDPEIPNKRFSKSDPNKKARSTRGSTRNQFETTASKDTAKLSRRSVHWKISVEESDNADSEIDIVNVPRIRDTTRSTMNTIDKRTSTTVDKSVIRTSVEGHESAEEIEMAEIEDTALAARMNQQDSPLSENRTSDKTVNRQTSSGMSIARSSNWTSVNENKKTPRATTRQQKSSGSQNNHSTPINRSSKNASRDISDINLSRIPRTIDDFFKVRQPTAAVDKQSVSNIQKSTLSNAFTDTKKMEKINEKLERIKKRNIAAMKMDAGRADKKGSTLYSESAKPIGAALKRAAEKKKVSVKPTKVVDKAFLVNGKVYKAPRLPRPKHWATDRLYKFLWKRMEPEYKLAARVKSEKFIQELAKMASLIERRKKYDNYKTELRALMKEMARMRIINTRNDFYDFCHDFLPYEFRVKVVPMLLPGNKKNIPYDPETLHTPILDKQNRNFSAETRDQ